MGSMLPLSRPAAPALFPRRQQSSLYTLWKSSRGGGTSCFHKARFRQPVASCCRTTATPWVWKACAASHLVQEGKMLLMKLSRKQGLSYLSGWLQSTKLSKDDGVVERMELDPDLKQWEKLREDQLSCIMVMFWFFYNTVIYLVTFKKNTLLLLLFFFFLMRENNFSIYF